LIGKLKMLISLSKYAAAHDKAAISVRQKARRGGFKTASPVMRRIFFKLFSKNFAKPIDFL